MAEQQITIPEILNESLATLTRAERQLADAILANYPISGLGSITELAETAGVSTPTVARMVQKLGFKGYPEFQNTLRKELEEVVSNPIRKRATWVSSAPDRHVLNQFTKEVTENIRRTLDQIDPAAFDLACNLIADPERKIYVMGGRITQTLASYLFMHLQMIRPDVVLIPSNSNAWPHYLIDLKPGDALIVFDVRRYENSTQTLAEIARERGAEIIVFTDQWRSPVQKHARYTFAARIEVPSAWDSSIATMLLVEAVIAAVQELSWDQAKVRMEDLEETFDRTRLFRKFV